MDNLCAIIDVNRLGNFWTIFYHYIFEMNFLIANLSLSIVFNKNVILFLIWRASEFDNFREINAGTPSKNLPETEVEQRNRKLREIEFEIFRENT